MISGRISRWEEVSEKWDLLICRENILTVL